MSVVDKERTACFNTQPPEGGWFDVRLQYCPRTLVSTHSRLKAAGQDKFDFPMFVRCFNTQPPEGGWIMLDRRLTRLENVSTHSRLKAAG